MDHAQLANLAQRLVAGLAPAQASLVEVACYRDVPDFARLDQLDPARPAFAAGSFLDFVFSKPTIDAGRVRVHAFEPLAPGGPMCDSIWLKLKRAEAVAALAPGAHAAVHPAALVNQALIDWARDQVPGSETVLVCGPDFDVPDGPTWLQTPLDITRTTQGLTVRAPTLRTPLDAPARFAGMHYMKAISPKWAIFILQRRHADRNTPASPA